MRLTGIPSEETELRDTKRHDPKEYRRGAQR